MMPSATFIFICITICILYVSKSNQDERVASRQSRFDDVKNWFTAK